MEAVPISENLWTVKVHNGTNGPITDLIVDVYMVDALGNRTAAECVPAKERMSIADLFGKLVTQLLPGALGAAASQAGMMPGAFMLPRGALESLPNYASMMAPQMGSMAAPRLNQMQAMMADSFPAVLPANEAAPVLFFTDGEGQLQADIRFADEDGNHWFRPFGLLPRSTE
ncbi:hypothetical protein [Nocardia sp. NPDC057227]|uniref:hypothetical protein n=1 Tax=Nocardia sp. NPDC057227 TaxID=3346056 RepID=UPI0036397429